MCVCPRTLGRRVGDENAISPGPFGGLRYRACMAVELNETELVAAVAAVGYELEMLRFAYATLANPAAQLLHPMLRNAVMESYLVHLRTLLDFFESKPNRDDLLACHLVEDWRPSEGGADLVALGSQRRDVNKWLNHLTVDRIRQPSQKEWDFAVMTQHVETVWSAFVARARLRPELREHFGP